MQGVLAPSTASTYGLLGGSLRILAAPRAGAAELMRLAEGAAVELLGQVDGWYRIRLPGEEQLVGYVPIQGLRAIEGCAPWGPAQARVKGAGHLWARYTYRLLSSHAYPNKVSTITMGARNLDGAVLLPGATARFNHLSGLDGELMKGGAGEGFPVGICEKNMVCTAGGICGLATTWFRTLFLSGLPIPDMASHGQFYTQYGFPGADAMVFEPGSDVVVVNDSAATLVVIAWAEVTDKALEVTVILRGTTSPDRTVSPDNPVSTMKFVPEVSGRVYRLARRVTRHSGAPFGGKVRRGVTLTNEGQVERWSFFTSYGKTVAVNAAAVDLVVSCACPERWDYHGRAVVGVCGDPTYHRGTDNHARRCGADGAWEDLGCHCFEGLAAGRLPVDPLGTTCGVTEVRGLEDVSFRCQASGEWAEIP